MGLRVLPALLLTGALAQAVIIDQIAVIVSDRIIKKSDIERNIRLTDYLNRDVLNFDQAARKKAADRLIDQVFIRHEIEVGDYPHATEGEAQAQLSKLKAERYRTTAAYQQSINKYGLTSDNLVSEFTWQLTVLRFVETRFRPAVLVSDDDLQQYYQQHLAELQQAHLGKSTFDDLQPEIRKTLTDERVNTQFFNWLDRRRKTAKLQFLEENLR